MLWLWISLGILGGVALIWLIIWCNNSLLKTTRYSFNGKVESPVKIVHLSDLHGKSFGAKNARLIAKIVKEKPDFIVFTGDIIHKYTPKNKKVALEVTSSLSAICPVLFVAGNHEMRNKGYRFFRKDLKEAGAVVLDDCPHNICGLTVVGLNCSSLKNGVLHKITPDCEYKLLLAHMPQFLDRYAVEDYDLVFSGHAHGGQWRIPFTGQGVFAPGQGLFPKLTEGVHTAGKTKMIISRGLGNSEFPLRLFNRPEIVVVTISPDDK
ncbi:MAG: metallophosphoesterase [Clostridia bacterium]|nr:metallophosphoesterase [Clostridia bacterium]